MDYVRESLEKSLVTQLEKEEQQPPIAILYAPEVDLDRLVEEHLREEGATLADRWGSRGGGGRRVGLTELT